MGSFPTRRNGTKMRAAVLTVYHGTPTDASGRDTGDAMKLSRDKVTDISHKIVDMLRKSHELRLKNKDTNAVRLEILRVMTDLLMAEDKVDRAARQKIRSQKKEIPEGSEEWDLLLRRYYSEELKKLGIDLAK